MAVSRELRRRREHGHLRDVAKADDGVANETLSGGS